jgi:hypothetical protein
VSDAVEERVDAGLVSKSDLYAAISRVTVRASRRIATRTATI